MIYQPSHNFDLNKIRQDFPILQQKIHSQPLIYFDNAATCQKPYAVIDKMSSFYKTHNANVHRGMHYLTEVATEEFEATRNKVRNLINAKHSHECIFVRGTTEAINLVANGFAKAILQPGDEIILSVIEHHANIVPWLMLQEQTGAKIKVIPCNDLGELDLTEYQNLLSSKTKLVSIGHISNSLGTINPIKEIIELAHQNNTPVFVDGAQGVPHNKINVQELDCDFYAFSGHKMYGPTGIGVLYGKTEWLEKLPPYQGGGEMIKEVSFDHFSFNDLPYKFEAGTPAICEVIGLGAAIDYLLNIGFDNIVAHEQDLLKYAQGQLANIPNIKFYGQAQHKAAIISFLIENKDPKKLGMDLDKFGIEVRTGRHCAKPTMNRFNISSTVRASFGIYNTFEEIDQLITALNKLV